MRAKAPVWLVGLSLLGSGCSVVSTGTQVVTSRIKESIEDCAERHRNQGWAAAAWNDVRSESPEGYSDDYGRGFESGFTSVYQVHAVRA